MISRKYWKVVATLCVIFLAMLLGACQPTAPTAPETTATDTKAPATTQSEKTTDSEKPTDSEQKTEGKQDMTEQLPQGYQPSEEATEYVAIQMDSGNHIIVELLPEKAPLTVANFQKLVGQSFYDNLIFHRIISGFMIQGGDPDGTGMGGSDEKIKGEFKINGVNNDLSHARGVISMARSQDPNSARSQFFICHADSTFLDGQYAAFGRVLEGLEEVDRIAALKTNANDYPDTPPVMEKVFFVKKS